MMKNNINIPIYITKDGLEFEFLDVDYIHHDIYIKTTYHSRNYIRRNKVNTFERIKNYATFGIFIRKINYN